MKNDYLVVLKMRRIEAEIASGKLKVISEKEALGKYKKELGLPSG